MNKHAYMIMAHNNFELLEMKLRLLDSEKNDFFIHIDTNVTNFDFEYFKSIPKHSKLVFTDRVRVTWGGFSMIDAELILLKSAIPGNYSYYHLISGVDMPLKTADEIYNFFESHQDTEFVKFATDECLSRPKMQERFRFYHIFQNTKGRNSNAKQKLDAAFSALQRMLSVDRTKGSPLTFRIGSQWFSITHKAAEYLCNSEAYIRKTFRYTAIPDEMVVQTMLYSSQNTEFKFHSSENTSDDLPGNVRLIDWKRGGPYTFRSQDLEELSTSHCIFARKFDVNTDYEICKTIFEKLSAKQ